MYHSRFYNDIILLSYNFYYLTLINKEPKMSYYHHSDVDEYGFKRPPHFNYDQYERIMSSYYVILARRAKKWHSLLKNNSELKKSNKLKRYVRKGIPSSCRTQVWLKISGAEDLRNRYGSNLYDLRLNTILDADIVQSIRMDLPRTFPENIFFIPSEGYQQQLYRVLFAHAADNVDIGYCQGLNYVAGLLLLVTKDESATFWLLKALVQVILPEYYTEKMTGLAIDIQVFANLVRRKMPQLHEHMNKIGVSWSLLVMKWFICLFAEVLPTESVLRIWDCLFYERSKIIFGVALTIVDHFKDKFLKCDNFGSFIEVFKSITSDVFLIDCHTFMKAIIKETETFKNKDIQRMRKKVTAEGIKMKKNQ